MPASLRELRQRRAAVTTTSATVLTSGSCRVAWAAAVEAKAVPASRVETTTRPDDRRSDRAGEAKGMRGRLQKKASRLNAIASDLQHKTALPDVASRFDVTIHSSICRKIFTFGKLSA